MDRLPRRRRAPGRGLLPTSRRQQPRLLHVQDPADVTDTDAPSAAYRVDPRSPHGFAANLRARRVHAEFTHGMDIVVSENLVAELMRTAGIVGLPGSAKVTRLKGIATADDLGRRKFHRLSPNKLWVNDITEHSTREGKVYCCAAKDTFSRKIVGWSIDNCQDSTLVVNALDMAIKNRKPPPGGIVHADRGAGVHVLGIYSQIRSAGLLPSFGTIGDGYDSAMMESFWSSMQIELLNRKKWRTRLDLASAIFDYIEIFYSRQRRHSQIDHVSPIEYELRFENLSVPA
ncbi:IS3 family transposase [Rhodococcus erythropolis]